MKTQFTTWAIGTGVAACLSFAWGGSVNYTYDRAGRAKVVAYSNGKAVNYTYDNSGNVTQRQFSGGADTDGDGMDDAWETFYFGNLSRNGAGDFDGDGMTDLAEFLAGTLPNNPSSALKVLPGPALGGGGVTVEWQSVSTKKYRLQFKNALSDPIWNDVLGDVTAGGTTASKVDTTATGQSGRYYRVKLIP